MCSLGYEHSTTRPHLVKSFDLKICKISCGSTFTIMTDIDGKVYTFGGQDEGAMGRDGEDYDGDLQVRGFIPTTATPVANEDSCIVKVAGGYAKSLALSIHGNLYAFGCHRDYHETHIREEPPDTNIADKNGKKFPFGFNSTPVQVSMPVPVVDMATGAFGNAAIGEDGGVYTWGVGTMGELGRPLAQDHIRDQDPKSARYYVDFVINDLMKPKIVPAIRGKVAISVACGQGHLMVVVREPGHLESTVYGSGLNKDGQLGLCDTQDRKILTPLAYTRTEQMMIREVKAGQFHTLALSLDGKRLYACGRNDYGQCGVSGVVSTPDARETKLKLIQFPNVDDLEIEQIACGELHNLAIGKPPGGHGRVYTWGSTVPAEDACCLGHGDEENEYRPRELVLTKSTGELVVGSVWRQASGGSQHSTFLYTPSSKSK
jgi:regulator of chromosome condensation